VTKVGLLGLEVIQQQTFCALYAADVLCRAVWEPSGRRVATAEKGWEAVDMRVLLQTIGG
jgi:hypothetical protein